MADSGKLAEFTFNSTVYDADDCLQSWDLADSINAVIYQCNSYDKTAVGTRAIVFTTSLALAATDTAKVAALYPGATGSWEGHPGGDTATYIEITSTKGTVVTANKSAPVNGIITLDLTINLDDVTYQAAS
jgi:hypothetical protein